MTNDKTACRRSTLTTLRLTALDILMVWLFISFVRFFVVENYRVPTGSMTPTLVGGRIAHIDIDGDGDLDYVVDNGGSYEILRNTDEGLVPGTRWTSTADLDAKIKAAFHKRHDGILVSKFAYWFAPPERGDVSVFKPPRVIYQPTAPIYVKRLVGLPDEIVSIVNDRLWINGKRVSEPEHFNRQFYQPLLSRYQAFRSQSLGPGEYMFFGDNTLNSADGRYWGVTPHDNIRGRVFFRYWPPDQIGFIE